MSLRARIPQPSGAPHSPGGTAPHRQQPTPRPAAERPLRAACTAAFRLLLFKYYYNSIFIFILAWCRFNIFKG